MSKKRSSRHHPRRGRPSAPQPLPWRWFGAIGVLLAVLIWQYWATLRVMIRDWQTDPNYSVGQLVPFVAAYLAWQHRAELRTLSARPNWILGIGLIVVALIVRLTGLVLLYESVERYSMVMAIVGLALLVAGWPVTWKLKWVLAFLVLMVPLPGKVHNLVSGPLQNQATAGAVFVLELVGVTVVREGNVMLLNDDIQVAVAEACSGLRMLTAFVVVSATLAYLIHRPRWQKAVLVVSSVPVAIICNLIRLCVTAALYLLGSGELAERFFHDFAGLTMMPLAVLMLYGELKLLDVLVVTDPSPAADSSPHDVR